MKHIYIGLTLLMFGCQDMKSDNSESLDTATSYANNNKQSIDDCIYNGDTNLGNNTYVRYVNMDSFFSVKVAINKYDTVLGYQFDCSTAHKYVPKMFFYSKDAIFLKVCSSSNYREVVGCELLDGKIKISYYETERSSESNRDIVVYKKNGNKDQLYLTGMFDLNGKIANDKTRLDSTYTINLPASYQDCILKSTVVEEKYITMKFSDGKILQLPLK